MKIVVLDGFVLNPGDNPWDAVARLGELIVYDRTPPELLYERCQGADIILTNKAPLDKTLLESLPQLRFIGVLATGYNVVDTEAAAKLGIPVCNVVAYGPDAVAEHVFALLLALTRDVGGHSASVRAGAWAQAVDWCYWNQPLLGLNRLRMGIIGFGNIGRKVGAVAHAFGMSVLACSHSQVRAPEYTPFAFVDVDTLFSTADVISLHCPLTEATYQLVNEQRLRQMKRGALLINTARGPLVDEAAVAAALHDGQLGGYGTDVLVNEPPAVDNPLCSAPRCCITPHIAWATLHARRNITRLTAENIAAWQAGTPRNVVNMPLQPR